MKSIAILYLTNMKILSRCYLMCCIPYLSYSSLSKLIQYDHFREHLRMRSMQKFSNSPKSWHLSISVFKVSNNFLFSSFSCLFHDSKNCNSFFFFTFFVFTIPKSEGFCFYWLVFSEIYMFSFYSIKKWSISMWCILLSAKIYFVSLVVLTIWVKLL